MQIKIKKPPKRREKAKRSFYCREMNIIILNRKEVQRENPKQKSWMTLLNTRMKRKEKPKLKQNTMNIKNIKMLKNKMTFIKMMMIMNLNTKNW